jgi:hypothetical protein
MKKKIFLFLSIFVAVLAVLKIYFVTKSYQAQHRLSHASQEVKELAAKDELHDGDIIFQTSRSAQSRAIQQATHSPYSHCGLVYKKENEYFVFEAVQPVKMTPLNQWIANGKEGRYVIKRLKNADQVLTPSVLKKMKEAGDRFTGKNYDLYFDWSDERIYCSELVWKIYKEGAGLEVGKLQKLKEFDLSSAAVKTKMKERYGDNIPLNETVISPAAIFNSEWLVLVKEN